MFCLFMGEEKKLWKCKDCNLLFGYPKFDPDIGKDRCPKCGSTDIDKFSSVMNEDEVEPHLLYFAMGTVFITFIIDSGLDKFVDMAGLTPAFKVILYLLILGIFGRTILLGGYMIFASSFLKANYKSKNPLELKNLNLTASIIVTVFLADNLFLFFDSIFKSWLLNFTLTAIVIPFILLVIYRYYVKYSRYLPPR